MNQLLYDRFFALLGSDEASNFLPEQLRVVVIKNNVCGVFRYDSLDVELSVGHAYELDSGKHSNWHYLCLCLNFLLLLSVRRRIIIIVTFLFDFDLFLNHLFNDEEYWLILTVPVP